MVRAANQECSSLATRFPRIHTIRQGSAATVPVIRKRSGLSENEQAVFHVTTPLEKPPRLRWFAYPSAENILYRGTMMEVVRISKRQDRYL